MCWPRLTRSNRRRGADSGRGQAAPSVTSALPRIAVQLLPSAAHSSLPIRSGATTESLCARAATQWVVLGQGSSRGLRELMVR